MELLGIAEVDKLVSHWGPLWSPHKTLENGQVWWSILAGNTGPGGKGLETGPETEETLLGPEVTKESCPRGGLCPALVC